MDLIRAIQYFSNPFLDMFFQLVTMIGEEIFFIFVTAIVYWCIDKKLGYRLGFVTLASACINFGIKDMMRIPRPIGEPGIRSLRLHTAHGYSFPSGHTQNTTTLWTFFMLYIKRGWLYSVGISVILLVGVSRLYLGVHTPADVAGGMLIGSVWVFICRFLYERAEKSGYNRLLFIGTAAAILGMLVFPEENYYKVTGALSGLLFGYIIEPRYINFEVRTSPCIQVFKVTFGLGILYLLRLLLKMVLPGMLFFDYLRYFLLIVWITIAAPYIFKNYLQNL